MQDKKVENILVSDIIPNRFQPRIKFDETDLNNLAESIKVHGIIQPLVLRKINDKYEIIAGERRFKASQLAGLSSVPAIIIEADDNKSAELAVIENLQRKELTSIEEAKSFKKLLDRGYVNQEELGKQLGISQSAISNKLRLLNLPDEVQNALLENKISERHARSLLSLKDANSQITMLNKIITNRLTVKQTDNEIASMLGNSAVPTQNTNIESIPSNPIENISDFMSEPTTVQTPIEPLNNTNLNGENNIMNQEINNPINFESLDTEEFNLENQNNKDMGVIESLKPLEPQQPLVANNFGPIETMNTFDSNANSLNNIDANLNNNIVENNTQQETSLENTLNTETINEPLTIDNTLTEQAGINNEPNSFNLDDLLKSDEPLSQNTTPVETTPEPLNNIESQELNVNPLANNQNQINPFQEATVENPTLQETEPIPVDNNSGINEISKEKDIVAVATSLKELIEKHKNEGYDIEIEEYDFEDMYQLIMKIKKNSED